MPGLNRTAGTLAYIRRLQRQARREERAELIREAHLLEAEILQVSGSRQEAEPSSVEARATCGRRPA
jgi:hypothetical protein